MKTFLKTGLLLAASALLMAGCNCYKKMEKNLTQIETSCNPKVLALKGSTVTADVKVSFAPKYFNKKAILRITPILAFETGEIVGTPKLVQGESVKDNYTVIPHKAGGSYTQNVVFPYDARAKLSTLELRVEAKCKNSSDFIIIAVIPVAQGISTVQNLAEETNYMSIMPDQYKRITTITQNADIMYLINSSQVRPVALNTDQVKLLEDFVKENSNKDRTTLGNVYAKGYASPDGPLKLNDELSKDRSNTAQTAISKKLKGVDVAYDAAAFGEDWEGFEKLVRESNIQDKDLILQVLRMYQSPMERDKEIKNMSQVYEVLKKDILPQLRRTQILASANVHGLTDAELKAAVGSANNNLNVEELLFAATLVDGNAAKTRIYKQAADKYNDVRGWNNYGVMLAQSGDLAGAKTALNKAASLKPAPEISNNLGAVALAEGNVAEAKRYLSSLSGSDAAANRALISLAEGDYATASKNLNGYNLAVTQLANGNVAAAKSALGNDRSADADYLKAVIAMRENKTTDAVNFLSSAISKKPALKEQAKKDVEFARIFGTKEFLAL